MELVAMSFKHSKKTWAFPIFAILMIAIISAITVTCLQFSKETSPTIASLREIYQYYGKYPDLFRNFDKLTVESTANEAEDSLRFETSYSNIVKMSTAGKPFLQVETESGVSVLKLSLSEDHNFDSQLVDGVLAATSKEIGVAFQPQRGVGVMYTVVEREQINKQIEFDVVHPDGTYLTRNGEGAILLVEADSQSDADDGLGISVVKMTNRYSLTPEFSAVESKLILTKNGIAIVFTENPEKTSPVASAITVLPTLDGSSFQ